MLRSAWICFPRAGTGFGVRDRRRLRAVAEATGSNREDEPSYVNIPTTYRSLLQLKS